MHDAITIGVPVFTILFAMLLNQRGQERLEARMETGFARLDDRMDRLEGRMDRIEGRMDTMQADLSRFYQVLGEHGGKIDLLSRK